MSSQSRVEQPDNVRYPAGKSTLLMPLYVADIDRFSLEVCSLLKLDIDISINTSISTISKLAND